MYADHCCTFHVERSLLISLQGHDSMEVDIYLCQCGDPVSLSPNYILGSIHIITSGPRAPVQESCNVTGSGKNRRESLPGSSTGEASGGRDRAQRP